MAQNLRVRTDDGGAVREELRAVMHAGRELPAQLDDTVIDAFMERLDRHIDARITQHDMTAPQPLPPQRAARYADNGATGILAVGIPFVVLAGVFGHEPGALLAVLVTGGLAGARMVLGSRR